MSDYLAWKHAGVWHYLPRRNGVFSITGQIETLCGETRIAYFAKCLREPGEAPPADERSCQDCIDALDNAQTNPTSYDAI